MLYIRIFHLHFIGVSGGVLWVLKHPARADPKKKRKGEKKKEKERWKEKEKEKERKKANDNENYLSPPTPAKWISNIPPWAHTSDAPTILGEF